MSSLKETVLDFNTLEKDTSSEHVDESQFPLHTRAARFEDRWLLRRWFNWAWFLVGYVISSAPCARPPEGAWTYKQVVEVTDLQGDIESTAMPISDTEFGWNELSGLVVMFVGGGAAEWECATSICRAAEKRYNLYSPSPGQDAGDAVRGFNRQFPHMPVVMIFLGGAADPLVPTLNSVASVFPTVHVYTANTTFSPETINSLRALKSLDVQYTCMAAVDDWSFSDANANFPHIVDGMRLVSCAGKSAAAGLAEFSEKIQTELAMPEKLLSRHL